MSNYDSSNTGAEIDAGIVLAVTATQPADVTAHNDDTTSVHGIADTSVLATDTDVGLKMTKQTLTDNALLKANSTGGEVQDTGIIIDDDNNMSGAGILANIQTGTTYELVLGDAGKLITLSNGSAITLTIPANVSVAFPIGVVIDLLQLGAGQVTVEITTDTMNSSGSKTKLTGQYSAAALVKITATVWVLFGDIAT